MRTLVVTNDFPPRPGGIQAYVHSLAVRQPEGEVVVYASSWKGDAVFDAAQPFPVVRAKTSVLLPTRGALREARSIASTEGCERVWFGAAAPLGLLARGIGLPSVASTHGHEIAWARLPVLRQVLQKVGRDVDALTSLGDYTGARLAEVMRAPFTKLPPGVDTTVFRPGLGATVRAELGLADRPVVVCVSRLVPRKGQDVLIRALPLVQQRIPDAALLLVGGGPFAPRLRELAASVGVADDVVMTGSVPWETLPAYHDAGDVFAMPCRSRYGGLEVEGLGIVFLEASACGKPVVAGRSGGSPDAVLDGETGLLVDGTDVGEVADRVSGLLADPAAAAAMGAAGRAWVERDWQWDALAERLRELLVGLG